VKTIASKYLLVNSPIVKGYFFKKGWFGGNVLPFRAGFFPNRKANSEHSGILHLFTSAQLPPMQSKQFFLMAFKGVNLLTDVFIFIFSNLSS
jgi:hypothetical protein